MMDMPLPEPDFALDMGDEPCYYAHSMTARDAQWRAYAAAEVAREREGCAALCDRFAARGMHPAECAAAIRAGSAKS